MDVPDVIDGYCSVADGPSGPRPPRRSGWSGGVIVLAQHLERNVEEALQKHGLSLGQFDILATLRRHGPEGRADALAVAGECDALVRRDDGPAGLAGAAKLVYRKRDVDDRLVVVVDLNAKGRRVIDAATATRFQEAARIAASDSSGGVGGTRGTATAVARPGRRMTRLRAWARPLQDQRHPAVPFVIPSLQRGPAYGASGTGKTPIFARPETRRELTGDVRGLNDYGPFERGSCACRLRPFSNPRSRFASGHGTYPTPTNTSSQAASVECRGAAGGQKPSGGERIPPSVGLTERPKRCSCTGRLPVL